MTATSGGAGVAAMFAKIGVEPVRVGTAVVFFARDRASALAQPYIVPALVLETLASWTDDQGQPFWVECDSQRPWPRRGPKHLRPSADLYGFNVPVTFKAPAWWIDAERAWRERRA